MTYIREGPCLNPNHKHEFLLRKRWRRSGPGRRSVPSYSALNGAGPCPDHASLATKMTTNSNTPSSGKTSTPSPSRPTPATPFPPSEDITDVEAPLKGAPSGSVSRALIIAVGWFWSRMPSALRFQLADRFLDQTFGFSKVLHTFGADRDLLDAYGHRP
jgi:hypothetical protein